MCMQAKYAGGTAADVGLSVRRIDLAVSAPLVSLVVCREFFKPTTFPFTAAIRNPSALMAKLQQIASLQRRKSSGKEKGARDIPQGASWDASDSGNSDQQGSPVLGSEGLWVNEGPSEQRSVDKMGGSGRGAVEESTVALLANPTREHGCIPAEEGSAKAQSENAHSASENREPEFLPLPCEGPWAVRREAL